MADVQVTFLEEPQVGRSVSIMMNNQTAHTSPVAWAQKHPTVANCWRVGTQSGSIYVGYLQRDATLQMNATAVTNQQNRTVHQPPQTGHNAAQTMQASYIPQPAPKRYSDKSRGAAILWAIALGWVGGHKFYLGRWQWGLLCLFFSWTFIPAILAIVDIVIYLTLSDEEFARRYA